MSNKDLKVLYTSGFGMLVVLIVLYLFKLIDTAQAIQIILTFALVSVTAVYVRWTAEIAKSTKEQADASVRPYLLLRLDLEDNVLLQWDTYQGKQPPSEFEVTILNAGKGPATNLEASLWDSKLVYFPTTRGFLAPNEEWQANISKQGDTLLGGRWLPKLRGIIKQDDPIIVVKYQDIHKRMWVSYLCLERHVDIEAFVKDGEQNIVEYNND
ncbi:MAG: hypothetical protein HY530_02620 [Chloroflexi bacterium]|nr:hypothetical protein [Chloroflexota bacterium]